MAEIVSIPGFNYLMDLMRLAHPGQPQQVEAIVAAWIERAEAAGVDPLQVRLAKHRLAVFRGEEAEVRVVAHG